MDRYILTAFGKDRPGIVAEVTRMLFENGCNLEDSSMTRLADQFTLMLLFSSSSPSVQAALEKRGRTLADEGGISVFLRPVGERKEIRDEGHGVATLHVEGLDQAGIVYRISDFLSGAGLNIVDLTSTVQPAPESGTALYVMDIRVQVPPETSLPQIEEGLHAVADELNVDIVLTR